MQKNPAAFTLIELMLSIMVIAIMASLVVMVINPIEIRKRVTDAQKKKDLQIIALALEQYYADHNSYPDTTFSGLSTYLSSTTGTQYLRSVPNDPMGGTNTYCYSSSVPGLQNFMLCAALDADKKDGTAPDGNYCTPTPDPQLDENYGRYCVVNPL